MFDFSSARRIRLRASLVAARFTVPRLAKVPRASTGDDLSAQRGRTAAFASFVGGWASAPATIGPPPRAHLAFFRFSQPTAPPEKSRFRLNAHTTPESHLLVANSKIELADEPLTNAPRARLVEGLGPAGAVRGSARAPDGTTDRAGDSARSPRRFGARGADQGKRDRHRSFGGPRPAASLGGRARGCRRLGRRPRGSGGFIVDTSRAFAGRASRSARARARVTSPRVDASPWRTIPPC